MVPLEGRYNCLVAIKTLRGRLKRREMGRGWCRKDRWGIRWVTESWKVGTETFFPFLSFSAELTHTTYAAFVSMRFSALNYNWGITHALWAQGKHCILSHFYLSTTFALALLLRIENAPDLWCLKPCKGYMSRQSLVTWYHCFLSLDIRGVEDPVTHTGTKQFLSFVWQFLFRWAHHQRSSTTCAATLLARHPTEYQNIITASERADIHPQHPIVDGFDEWLIATTSLIEWD